MKTLSLKKKVECPKCGSRTETIFYFFGIIRNRCVKCHHIFKAVGNKK